MGATAAPAAPSVSPSRWVPLSVPLAMMGVVTSAGLRSDHPLVGRAEELAEIGRVLGLGQADLELGAARSQRQAVVLGGDAGVGKSRLLAELGQQATDLGWRVLVGHCLDFGEEALAYLPFTEMLGRADDGITQAAADHPAIARLLPGHRMHGRQEPVAAPEVGVDPGGSGTGRRVLFEAVHATLSALGARQPTLVIVEDVHWADPSTRDLLSFLFTRGFAEPVAVVASYRADDLHRRHPLRPVLAEWSRLPGVHRLVLPGLTRPDLRALVQHRAGAHREELAEPDLAEIVARAGGNPFFAEELLAARLDRGPAGEVGDGTVGGLPSGLAELLLVRLDRLDERTRTVVAACACAGRRVPHDLLAAVMPGGDGDLDAPLRAAVEANILLALPDGSYAFRHALLAEAVYDDLLPGERTRWHGRYAAALAEGRAEGTAAELARHARAAHDLPTALTASVAAGEDAAEVGGPEEAARHFQAALELWEGLAPEARPELDVALLTVRAAESLVDSGHDHRAVQLLRRLLERQSLPDERRALALCVLAIAALRRDLMEVDLEETSREALQLAGPAPTPLRARALLVQARVHILRDRFDEASRFAEEALQLAERHGVPGARVEAATLLGRLREFAGDPEAADQELAEVVAEARRAGARVALVRALHQQGHARLEMGRAADAHLLYREAADLAARLGRPWAPHGFEARALAGVTAYLTGRWEEALAITDTTGQSPPPAARAILAAVELMVRAGRGEDGVIEAVARSRPDWHADGWVAIMAGGAAIDGYGDGGRVEEAAAAHDEAVAAVRELWQVGVFHAQTRLGALLLAQLAGAAERAAGAERQGWARRGLAVAADLDAVAARLAEEERPAGPEGRAWQGRVWAERLRLQWLAGDATPEPAELTRARRQDVEAFTGLGHDFEAARSRARLARVLRATGQVEQAVSEEELAAETAGRLRARPLLAELGREGPGSAARAAGGRDAVAAAGGNGVHLTPREHEVLLLVEQGLSNGDIARRLFVTTKTVSVHVSNVLAKLGARSRTEAVAVARRSRLLG